MRTYNIEFTENGADRWQTFRANTPGRALLKCKRAHPAALLKCCVLQGYDGAFIKYDAPPNQALPSKPVPDNGVQETMAFYATEVLSRKPL
jgi:hypothetical protein